MNDRSKIQKAINTLEWIKANMVLIKNYEEYRVEADKRMARTLELLKRKPMKKKLYPGKKKPAAKRYRSAITGRMVTAAYAKRYPHRVVGETVKPKSRS